MLKRFVANVQVVQPLRQQTAGPLGCSWGAHAERTPVVSLCVVLVSVLALCTCIPTDTYFAAAVLTCLLSCPALRSEHVALLCWL